jgi:hypothetical protein
MLVRFTVFVMIWGIAAPIYAKTAGLSSPDGTIEVIVNDQAGLSYSVEMDGRTVIADSKLEIELTDGIILGKDARIVSDTKSRTDQTWQSVVGNRTKIVDKYTENVIEIKDKSGRQYSIVFRAYDDGAAFRYVFNEDFGQTVSIREEHSEFTFEQDFTCWPAFLNHYQTEHQALYPKETLSSIMPEDIIGLPLTIQLDESLYCSVAEAALTDWAGVYVTRQGQSEPLIESTAFVRGGQPFVFKKAIPEGTRKLRIVVDAAGGNSHDHVDIADAKLTMADGQTTWLSDLKPVLARQEWGQLKNDKSVDGNLLNIAGKRYPKGLGTHSNAVIVYKLPEGCVEVEGAVGIDDEVGQEGKAIFKLFAVQEASQGEAIVLKSTLSRLKEEGPAVEVKTPHVSPWRVIMLGRKPVDLVNSDIILNLNEPSKIEDTSWIQPGVSSWNWLSCGGDMDMKLLKSFIDLSASMEWDYTLIDDGWYKGWNCTESIDGLDIPELVSYAAQKNVKIWLWVHWQALDRRLEESFALYEKWHIAGIKTDFMSRDDQWMVNWYHKVLETAAKHKIMINFHGCYKPTGIRRTWPNLMTREAVYGEEQNLGSRQNDAVHKTTLPFTRMLAGPMDYTPGSMLNETRESWSAGRPVKTLGTRAQELAICVIYDNPILSMADKPENYSGQKGVEFLQNLPTSWDDTRVLDGQIGEFIVSARRKGDTWYIGAITNWDARSVTLPLAFLDKGRYAATLFEDGPEAGTNARDIQKRDVEITVQDSLTIKMVSGGGFTAILKKVEQF